MSATVASDALAPIEMRALGYRFHPATKSALLARVFSRSRSGRLVIASANLHGLFMFERHAEYRALHERSGTEVMIDGMPIIWLLKLLGRPVTRAHRTTWVDWFEDALDRAASDGLRVYVVGHTTTVLAAGLEKAAKRWPHLAIGASDGYFDIDDRAACLGVVQTINAFGADILFVGMGMPKQEIFVERYGGELQTPVIGLGGAAFAYFAGDQASPPRWMGRAGLEWAYRLAGDPRRLAARYLVEPLLLAAALIRRSASAQRAGN